MIRTDGNRITQHFGVPNPRYAAKEHTGVDFGDSGSDAISATASRNRRLRRLRRSVGKPVIVKHAGDRYPWYCHLASTDVKKGDTVKRGTKVGMMGNTGNSTAKHLHYQESTGGYGYRDYTKPRLLGSADTTSPPTCSTNTLEDARCPFAGCLPAWRLVGQLAGTARVHPRGEDAAKTLPE